MATIPLYPYGYKLNYLGKKEVHKERASVVQLIYQKYIEGMNRYAITCYLANHKILRPRGDSYDWQYSMVNRILSDERYIGTEKYPQILSREIFEVAQETRKKEKEKAISKMHESCNGKRVYPFSGFIKCESCGSNYIRGIQHYKDSARKASWRCRNYNLKNEGKCKASGNIYEEVLEIVCVEAYNKVRKDCIAGKLVSKTKKCSFNNDKSLEVLIEETILQMKDADEKRLQELQNDLNVLLNERTVLEWSITKPELTDYETNKIISHFEKNQQPMKELDIERFKEVFDSITAFEPGKLKLILKNGIEIFQEYKPMKGQVENAKKHRSYTSEADKRT